MFYILPGTRMSEVDVHFPMQKMAHTVLSVLCKGCAVGRCKKRRLSLREGIVV